MHKAYDRFLDAAVAIAGSLRVGDPADPGIEVGPLVTAERLERLTTLVEDARAGGATVHCGGPVPVPGVSGAFFAPAVVSGVGPGMKLWNEEAPGPVLVVHRAEDEEEAIRLANASQSGLGASVWTADRFKGARIARELQVGMVWMNDHLVARSAPQVPWGGVKGSGIGRARGAIALRTCAEPKVVTWDPPVGRPAWWFPYDETLERAARAVLGLRSARDSDRERALREGGAALFRQTGRWARALRSGR
jgi:succinate-semialdehyde dehydrogenase/glutarate-semialdehyde dehydrogenase